MNLIEILWPILQHLPLSFQVALILLCICLIVLAIVTLASGLTWLFWRLIEPLFTPGGKLDLDRSFGLALGPLIALAIPTWGLIETMCKAHRDMNALLGLHGQSAVLAFQDMTWIFPPLIAGLLAALGQLFNQRMHSIDQYQNETLSFGDAIRSLPRYSTWFMALGAMIGTSNPDFRSLLALLFTLTVPFAQFWEQRKAKL